MTIFGIRARLRFGFLRSRVCQRIWIFSDYTDFRRFSRFGIPRYFDEVLLDLFGGYAATGHLQTAIGKSGNFIVFIPVVISG